MKRQIGIFTVVSLFFSACSIEDVRIEEKAEVKIENLANRLNAEIEIDKSVTKDNAIIIRSEKEFVAFIDSVKNQHYFNDNIDIMLADANNLRVQGCVDGIYSGTAIDTPLFNLVFDVSVSNGCISDINGGLTGVTFMIGYTQGATQFGCSSGTVCGTLDYNIFWEGIGTVYRHRVCYKITLIC
jgi:hypothetical protein